MRYSSMDKKICLIWFVLVLEVSVGAISSWKFGTSVSKSTRGLLGNGAKPLSCSSTEGSNRRPRYTGNDHFLRYRGGQTPPLKAPWRCRRAFRGAMQRTHGGSGKWLRETGIGFKSWLIDMGLPVAKSTMMNHPQVVGATVGRDL